MYNWYFQYKNIILYFRSVLILIGRSLLANIYDITSAPKADKVGPWSNSISEFVPHSSKAPVPLAKILPDVI